MLTTSITYIDEGQFYARSSNVQATVITYYLLTIPS